MKALDLAATERHAAAAAEAAGHAREALDALTRAENIAAAAAVDATREAAAAREAHEAAVAAAEKADAAWAAVQTAGAWANVERCRSLREQAGLRAAALDTAREQALAAVARARRDVVTARADAENAAARAAACTAAVDDARRRAEDAAAVAASTEAELLAKREALMAEVDAFAARAAELTAAPLARYVAAVEACHRAEAEAVAALVSVVSRGRTLASRGRALGAFVEPPAALALDAAPERVLAAVANRSLAPRGVTGSKTTEALAWCGFARGGGGATVRAIIDAGVRAASPVEAPTPSPKPAAPAVAEALS